MDTLHELMMGKQRFKIFHPALLFPAIINVIIFLRRPFFALIICLSVYLRPVRVLLIFSRVSIVCFLPMIFCLLFSILSIEFFLPIFATLIFSIVSGLFIATCIAILSLLTCSGVRLIPVQSGPHSPPFVLGSFTNSTPAARYSDIRRVSSSNASFFIKKGPVITTILILFSPRDLIQFNFIVFFFLFFLASLR